MDNISYKKGYYEEMGRLVAQQDFEYRKNMAKQQEYIIGLQTGRYQPQPDGTVITFY